MITATRPFCQGWSLPGLLIDGSLGSLCRGVEADVWVYQMTPSVKLTASASPSQARIPRLRGPIIDGMSIDPA